jgi:hypothetical protein
MTENRNLDSASSGSTHYEEKEDYIPKELLLSRWLTDCIVSEILLIVVS